MPKITNTKKQRAAELLERLQRGPSLSSITGPLSDQKAAAAAQEQYQLWVKTWVLPDLVQLVPELRQNKRHPLIASENCHGQVHDC